MSHPERLISENEFERTLSNEEVLAFADIIIWPTIDFLHGGNFRAKAQRKESVVVPRKTQETATERITVYAQADTLGRSSYDIQTSEPFRPCEAVVMLETRRPELADGVTEAAFIEDIDSAQMPWYENPEISWDPWEVHVFCFSTDPQKPLSYYYSIQAQNEEELYPPNRQLWDSTVYDFATQQDRLPDTEDGRKSAEQAMAATNGYEDMFAGEISFNDCLEIRKALIRFGIPASILDIPVREVN